MMSTLKNTKNYAFVSGRPLFIVNKVLKSGAMRPIAYFAVTVPRTGSVLSTPMKETFKIYGDDGSVQKIIRRNVSSPCGDPYGSVGNAVLEVPCYSDKDPDNEVADQSHNLYEQASRRKEGSFTDDPVSSVIEFMRSDQNVKQHTFMDTASLFGGIDNDAQPILEHISVDKQDKSAPVTAPAEQYYDEY